MNRRTLLRAGVGLTATLASRKNHKADTPTRSPVSATGAAAPVFNCEKNVCAEPRAHDFGKSFAGCHGPFSNLAGNADVATPDAMGRPRES